ncbi:MAG: ATP-binding protein [Sediminicola sp.]
MQITVEDLQRIAAISEVPTDQLQWLISKGTLLNVAKGEFLFKKGDPMDRLIIFLEGEVMIKMEQNGHFKDFGTAAINGISGFLPYSRANSSIGYGQAEVDCRLLVVDKAHIREMATLHYELTEALVHVMTSRTREFAKLNVQAEKMMALGKLSAGLAHELNNPASAIASSAKELKRHHLRMPEDLKRIFVLTLEPQQIDILTQLLFQLGQNSQKRKIGLLERTEMEDKLEEWLGAHKVKNGADLSETLLDFGVDIAIMDHIFEVAGAENFEVVIKWMAHELIIGQLVGEIGEAANRIATLVQSVKTYTHMDQAPEAMPTDIVKGLHTTLVILDHKLKRKRISVEHYYGEQLPWPKVRIGEMNQVWTNLIDNAVDAMEENGKLTLSVDKHSEYIRVQIKDNGKGIPLEHQQSIFDPFFTTKPIGEGTGMGLEVVKRIVEQHNGQILMESEQGKTVFTVLLPIAP